MSTDNRYRLLHPRTRFALARAVQSLGEWLFDELAWIAAACRMADSVGFVVDEETVQRYLAIPGADVTPPLHRNGRNDERSEGF